LERDPHAEVLAWYRELIRLRRRRPELRDGRLPVGGLRFDERERWLVFERGSLAIACNFADRASAVAIGVGAGAHLLAASNERAALELDVVHLPTRSAVIVERAG